MYLIDAILGLRKLGIGRSLSASEIVAITSVDFRGWGEAVPQIRDHYAAFGDRLPSELATALDALESSLS